MDPEVLEPVMTLTSKEDEGYTDSDLTIGLFKSVIITIDE